MSIRPRAGNPVRRVNDVRRHMWSESPIPRVASRRVRSAYVAPIPPEWLYWDYNYARDLPANVVTFDPAWQTCVTGDHWVAVAVSTWCEFAAPAGWSEVATAAPGSNVRAKIFHIVAPSNVSTDIVWDFATDGPTTFGGTYQPEQASAVHLMRFGPTSGTLQAVIATSVGTTSHTVANVGASWVSPWQAYVLSGAGTVFGSWSYDKQITLGYNPVSPYGTPATHNTRSRINGPTLGGGYGPMAPDTVIYEGTPGLTGDWITCALGWK